MNLFVNEIVSQKLSNSQNLNLAHAEVYEDKSRLIKLFDDDTTAAWVRRPDNDMNLTDT